MTIQLAKNDRVSTNNSKIPITVTEEFRPISFNTEAPILPHNVKSTSSEVVSKCYSGRHELDNTCNIANDTSNKKDGDIIHILENRYNRHGMACDYNQKHKLLFIGGGFDLITTEFCRKSEGMSFYQIIFGMLRC